MTLLGVKRSRTTAYHPQANGMVERFHRQLKASLITKLHPDMWMDALPLVLLGIHSAFKEDISATAAELVYGTTLRLPREFFVGSSTSSALDPTEYVDRLKSHPTTLRPCPPRLSQRHSYISSDLSKATHVFVRRDCVRKPLQPPYDGPFRVINRNAKYFAIDFNNQHKNISIDRLKSAHIEDAPSLSSSTDFHSLTQSTCSTDTELKIACGHRSITVQNLIWTAQSMICMVIVSSQKVLHKKEPEIKFSHSLGKKCDT